MHRIRGAQGMAWLLPAHTTYVLLRAGTSGHPLKMHMTQ